MFVRKPIVSLRFEKIPFSISCPGIRVLRTQIDVRETTLGAGNTNNADITYSFKGK
jgi:hypothetical protein